MDAILRDARASRDGPPRVRASSRLDGGNHEIDEPHERNTKKSNEKIRESLDGDAPQGIGNDRTYTGRELDPETGLQLNRFRFYHQQLGRWGHRDPIGYSDGLNLYEYVASRPIIQLDPSGERPVKCCRRVRVGDVYKKKICKFVRVPDSFKPSPCNRPDREVPLTPDEDTATHYCLGDRECEEDLARILNNANNGRLSDYPLGFGNDTCNTALSEKTRQFPVVAIAATLQLVHACRAWGEPLSSAEER